MNYKISFELIDEDEDDIEDTFADLASVLKETGFEFENLTLEEF